MIFAPEAVELTPRVYLNGFPKAGTHALATMAHVIMKKASKDNNWLGDVSDFAFGKKDEELVKRALDIINVFTPNVYIRGHMAYDKRIAEAMYDNEVAHVFIFRDFRDVAVSAAHHAARDDGGLFPEKEYYQSLGFDERLKRIITGDENITGVMERWEEYAPWLDVGWVLKIVYEDFIEHPRGVANMFLRYIYGKTAGYNDIVMEMYLDDFEFLVGRTMKIIEKPEVSPTYREGKIGKWKEHFTEEHKELFKQTDKNDWLVKLGYEENRDW